MLGTTVLILVVMDDALALVLFLECSGSLFDVLILVVMDDALALHKIIKDYNLEKS